MDVERIVKLLSPFLESDADQLRAREIAPSISIYVDILLRWNSRMNLTAIRDPEDIVQRHFGESLFAARQLFPVSSVPPVVKDFEVVEGEAETGDVVGSRRPGQSGGQPTSGRAALQRRVKGEKVLASATSVADIGSGAGFPGIPIKLWAPQISLALIESNQKKSVFLREVTRSLTLMNVDIQNARAESLPQASFDVVTLRAVERFDTILPTAAALLAPSGGLALLIGDAQVRQVKEILPNFEVSRITPIPESLSRVLLLANRFR